MSIRWLFFVLISCTPWLSAAVSYGQIARLWNTTSGDWSTPINWLPNGVPAFNDGAFIGNSAAAENATVFLDIDDSVASVNITDGMSIQTQGNTLLVLGNTTISGSNTVPLPGGGNVIHDSRITLIRGANPDDYDTDDLTVTDGGRVSLIDGAILEVDETLNVDSDSSVRGEGVIRFPSAGTVYINDGTLDPTTGGMTIDVTGGGALDLDGTFGNGRLSISAAKIDGTAFDNLTINGGTIADPFSGEISIAANGFLAMNTVAPWSTSSGSEIEMHGNSSHPGPALISGADLTIGGVLDVSGSDAHGQIDANTTFATTANVIVGTSDRLELTGTIDVEGGVYTIGDNSVIEFEGPTTIRGGTFISLTDFPAFDTSVALEGDTEYRGTVTFTGNTRQFGDATVAATTVINAEVFDMSGVVTTWDINASATINADRIEGGIGPNPPFNGTINVSSGIPARLIINLSDPNEAWVMGGTLNLNGLAFGTVTKLAGSAVTVSGTLNASNRVTVTADANFTDTSTIDFAGATTILQMRGETTVSAGATFSGAGVLENHADGVMSLEAGLSTGQVGVTNRGRLQSDNVVGVVAVDRFVSIAGATLVADVGKNTFGTDSDVLSISSGTAELAGDLQPRVVQLGGTPAPFVFGDSFQPSAA